ncbi:MAG: efflux RND transporter periplasmic adaptor subunit [Tepidisphaeraceae bacterium]
MLRLRKIGLGIFLLFLLGAGVWLVSWLWRPQVTVTSVSTGPVVQAFYATGTVRPIREYPIKANTAGILWQVIVDKGSVVKAGQPLAVLNEPSLQYAATNADAELEEKKKRLEPGTSPVLIEFDDRLRIVDERIEIAQRDFDRFESLVKTSAASKSDRDQALDKLKMLSMESASLKKQRDAKMLELQRELATAQAASDTAHWNLNEQTLKAPIDGVVLDRPTSQGTRVAVNDITMRIADVRPQNLVMRAQVDEEDVTHCHVGQLVRMSLYAFAGKPLTGRVKQIYDEADQDRRTFEVDVQFDESPDRLAAGMTGELAFIESEKSQANVLPSTALQGGRLCVVRDGKLVDTNARIGLQSVERIEVLDGITKDDQVVVSPLGTITDGTRVRTTYVDPAKATPVSAAQKANAGAASIKAF